jgi:transmembrane secretion effector
MQTIEETTASTVVPATPRRSPFTMLGSGPFRNLWLATTLSLFGDFFSYIAIAWLVLQLTGSSLLLGSVLVVQALPRAVLVMVGGALADRLTPRLTMLGSMALRAAFVAPLAVLVLTGRVQMWQVYGIAFVFGVVDAFFMPARQSILPRVVADRELEAGNAVLNVTAQASVILGPVVGALIVQALGIGWAFAADAASFAVGLVFVLLLPTVSAAPTATRMRKAEGGLGGQIVDGLRYAWADVGIRVMLIAIAVIDFGANGALGVGLPTLAHGRFAAGASGLGIPLGAWGVGATAGALLSGFVAPPKRFGWMIVFIAAWLGILIGGVGLVPSLLPAALLMGIAGIGTGVVNTYGLSWLQRRTDRAMQGRVMSIVMLASMGLTPVAYAVSGPIAQVNPTLLFMLAGGMMLACAAGAAVSRTVRSLR